MEDLKTKDILAKVTWKQDQHDLGRFEIMEEQVFIDGKLATMEEEYEVAKLITKGMKVKHEVTTMGSNKPPFITNDFYNLTGEEIQALI